MLYLILIVEIFLFGLVFYRLVTTNHWTIGKKLLVGLSAGILVEGLGFIAAMLFSSNPMTLVFIKIPKMICGAIMVYFFYRHEHVVH
jgi:hypothetical protein